MGIIALFQILLVHGNEACFLIMLNSMLFYNEMYYIFNCRDIVNLKLRNLFIHIGLQ